MRPGSEEALRGLVDFGRIEALLPFGDVVVNWIVALTAAGFALRAVWMLRHSGASAQAALDRDAAMERFGAKVSHASRYIGPALLGGLYWKDATRTGACTVAGVEGSEWSRTEEGVAKTVCVTDDGIFLRGTEGGRTTWEATRVVRGPQPADQFAAPEGVRVMDMSNMGGMMDAIQQGQRP